MGNLDATVITTALPAMAADFGTTASYLSVGVSAYLVALTVFIPISGWLTDRWGARRVFSSAIILFSVSSLLCALSDGLWSFTAARILQGIGGAMMVPVGRLVVLRDTPKEDVVRAIAILTWPALVAPVMGPPVGGWIATHWGWPWIFWLNVPLGVAALIAAWVLIRDGTKQRAPFDLTGFLLAASAFGLFMAGIEAVSRDDVSKTWAVAILAISVPLFIICTWHLRRASHPLFGLGPMKIATFRITVVGGSLFRTAIGTAPFLLPLMFQLGLGWSAVKSGMLLLWLFAGNLVMKVMTTRIINTFGFKRVLIINGLAVAAGFAACGPFTMDTPYWLIGTTLFLCGMGRSMQFTALNTIGFADVPQSQMRDATTLFSVLQQMNAGMGIAVGALALSSAHLMGATPGVEPVLTDYRIAFWLIAGMALLAVADSLCLSNDAGERVLVRRAVPRSSA